MPSRPTPSRAADDAQLLAAILALPASRLDRLCDALAGQPAVAAIGWRVCERPLRPERHPERNGRIRSLRALGRTLGQIALDVGASRDAVRGVLRRDRRKSGVVQSAATPHAVYAGAG